MEENNGEDRGVASRQSLVSSWRLHDCHDLLERSVPAGNSGRRPIDFESDSARHRRAG